MSMLAEPRRKQKWSLNPRGKEWSQDTNKFGQKMLEKMGWQHGKGLGAKESGITEHIKVSYKNDSKGMGYKESNDQWTEHETNFSALLQSLGGSGKIEEVKVNSLEKKSQSSRARVHYQKFTRGKDLSRYSEKDLANIFGKKSLKEVKIEDPVTVKSEDTSSRESASGFYFNAGSMRDYFKKKLPGFGNSHGYMLGNNGVLKKADDNDSESELKPSFGFGFKSENPSEDEGKTTFKSYIKEDSSTKRKAPEAVEDLVCSPMKKRKKDKKKKEPEENLGLTNPSFNPLATPIKIQKHILEPIEEGFLEENEESPVQTLNEKKKRKNVLTVEEPENYEHFDDEASCEQPMKNTVETVDAGTFNPIFNESVEDGGSFETTNNPYEVKVKKKKKKKRDCESGEISVADERDTSRKNTGAKSHFDNPNFVQAEENSDHIEAEENPFEVKIKNKKKKNKKVTAGVENSETEDKVTGPDQFEDNPYGVEVKKKKKKTSALEHQESNDNEIERVRPEKKKTKKDTRAIDNPSFNDAEDSFTGAAQVEENPYEVRKKKKTKKQPVDNPSYVDSIEPEIEAVENPYEIKVKKKKKSKKNKDSNPAEADSTPTEDAVNGITNPALRLDDTTDNLSINEDSDLMFNIVSTPVTREERTTTVDSVTKINSVRRRKSVRFSDVTQERIIPNKEDMRELYEDEASRDKSKKKRKEGLDNVNFDKQKTSLEENLDSISKTLDTYQAEIDNDINEEKLKTVTMEDIMVGEVGNPHGKNEQLPDGTRLKFKYANLNAKTPFYHLDKVGPKKSYKHLIKGDILVMFKGTNLHKVKGYGARGKAED